MRKTTIKVPTDESNGSREETDNSYEYIGNSIEHIYESIEEIATFAAAAEEVSQIIIATMLSSRTSRLTAISTRFEKVC